MQYRVESEVFERFPGFRRMVVVAKQVNNTAESPELVALLRQYEERARGEHLAEFRAHPSLAVWDQTFLAMGLKPNRFPPSVINLVKRVRAGKDLPYINTLVATFNCISLKYLMPCGGDDLGVVTGDLCLGIAKGNESYVPLGQPDVCETPPAGEIIYYDTGNLDVFCRAWCWKNGDRSKMTPATTATAINIDGMATVPTADTTAMSLEHIQQAAAELAALVQKYTGAQTEIHAITPENREFTIS